jgi:Bacterial TSP3 repeat
MLTLRTSFLYPMKNYFVSLVLLFGVSALRADQTVTTGATSGQNKQVSDPGKISTSGTVVIQSGATAVFTGGASVTLLPGFQALSGSLFRATRDLNIGNFNLDDTDFDGLPDAWEILHFGNLNATGAQDSDGDGVSNLDEYFAGTNPTLNEATTAMPGGSLVVLKIPTGKFKRVTTSWDVVAAP